MELPPKKVEVLIRTKDDVFVGFISDHNKDRHPYIYSHLTEAKWEIGEIVSWSRLPDTADLKDRISKIFNRGNRYSTMRSDIMKAINECLGGGGE